MALSEKLIASGFPRPSGNSKIAWAIKKNPVGTSPEFDRIISLPRRQISVKADNTVVLKWADKEEKVPDLTPVFAKPGGKLKLRPLQNAALWEAYNHNGGFFMLSVGEGKTLIALLLAEAMNSKKTVLLVKPELRNQLLKKDLPFYRQHFNLPLDRIYVVAYSELSSVRKAEVLEKIQPDLVIADEAHKLRLRSAARTRRFLRYMRRHPETRFVGLSGTFLKRSLTDFAHLIELALKKNSPIPNNFKDLEEWGEALDVSDDPKPAGVLAQFCGPDENVRQGFRRRLVETPGVVASTETSIGTSLIIQERKLEVPMKVKAELAKLYDTWQIGEEELTDAMSLMRVAREICCGFWYRWDWSFNNGIRDDEWIRARRSWHKECRSRLLQTSIPGMDSPLLLYNAAKDGRWLAQSFFAWEAVKNRPEPPTVPVWVDYYLLKDAVRWGKEREKDGGAIIWTEYTAIGEAIAKIGDWPYFGIDADASAVDKTKNSVIVCSIKSQSEGKNLQAWNRALVTSPPANGTTWEQLLGRKHRPGQEADEVIYEVYLHTSEFKKAFEQAVEDAKYVEETNGQQQKLNFAQIIYLSEIENEINTGKILE